MKKLILISAIFAVILSGCATVTTREALPTYSLNNATYYALVPLCNARGIEWQYDTYSKIVGLNKDNHRINLMVGDTLVLVDGKPQHLNHPVDIYQGALVVPEKFKEEVIDSLFQEYYPGKKAVLTLTNIKKVVIDAGHGGNDPGTTGRTGLREKDVNLDLAKRLGNLFKAQGVAVVYTRSSDRFIPLAGRVDIANRSGADLFISVHSNANRVRSLNGFEVYYIAGSVNDNTRAQSAARSAQLDLEGADFAGRSLDLRTTLWDMIYTYNRAESIELSRSICRAMGNDLDTRVIGVKGARYYVLKGARMPAVLIEVGFLSNSNEERMLKNGFYRQKVAEAIMEGVADYSHDASFMEAAKR
ncbi:MAG: N-acetylmuramoyl-L-alanine amidase [Candidatus Omnitrophica bacterium]|nr:N-acetylmuramoyl-L-alanine amidase [Candidatus Omnitrophota bacterium]